MKNQIIKVGFYIFPFLFAKSLFCQSITINRQFENDNCTMGYLTVDDSLICHTLERADYANSKSVSRIPKGSYQAFIRVDKPLGWRIELVDVPDRENIEIHIGNYPFQTTGCVLVGNSVNTTNCTILNSKLAIGKLKTAVSKLSQTLDLESNSTEKYKITIVFK